MSGTQRRVRREGSRDGPRSQLASKHVATWFEGTAPPFLHARYPPEALLIPRAALYPPVQGPYDMLSSHLGQHILNYEPPHGFVIPPFVMYDGSSDSYDHMLHFNQAMILNAGDDRLLCKVFPASLKGPAFVWFHNAPPQFTPVNIAYDRLLPLIRDLPDFKWPPPIRAGPNQRNRSLRYDYHRDHDHETNHCQSLKFLIEKLIRAGHIRRYIQEPSNGVATAPTADRAIVDTVHASGSRPAINFILGGPHDSQYQSKKQRRKMLRAASIRARVHTVSTKENITVA